MTLLFYPPEGECSECGHLMAAEAVNEHPALAHEIACKNRFCKEFDKLYSIKPIMFELIEVGTLSGSLKRKAEATSDLR